MSYRSYPKYKDSGVPWLGEVPEQWNIKPTWTLFRRTKRIGFENEQLLSVYREHGVVPKASRDDNNNKASDDLSVYQLVKPGDLAINKMKAWQGSVAISEYHGIVSPAYFTYKATHQECSKYLHYLLRSPRYVTGYLSISKGIRVNQWDLEPQCHSRMPVILPTRDEQNSIAIYLDRETAKIDALISTQRRLIDLLREKRSAQISHAVTKGLNPDAPMKDSGVEWLGKVPEGWEVLPLKRITRLCTERAESRLFPIGLEHIESWSGRLIAPSEDPEFEGDGTAFQKGDILFGKLRPYLAKAWLATCEGEAVGDFHVIRVQSPHHPAFVQRILLSQDAISLIDGSTYGAKMPRASWDFIGGLPIPIPRPNEQTAIAAFLDRETAKIDALISKTEKAIELAKERRSALISAAVTGKIDVREAA